MIKKWYGLARILPKCYLKLLHPFVCYSLSKDRCSAWKLPICCFDSIRAFDYRNCSHIAIYPSYIIFEYAPSTHHNLQKLKSIPNPRTLLLHEQSNLVNNQIISMNSTWLINKRNGFDNPHSLLLARTAIYTSTPSLFGMKLLHDPLKP